MSPHGYVFEGKLRGDGMWLAQDVKKQLQALLEAVKSTGGSKQGDLGTRNGLGFP